MTWKAYQVTFQLLSPMHIGWRKLGNLQQTRPYLTGRTLWGALTARLTREAGGIGKDYEAIGKKVDEQLAFTYFYPSTVKDSIKDSLWPWPDKKWDEFAWKFMGSYAGTSLSNGRNAEDGSLHETEFIAPHTRGEDSQQVYLVGYIFEKEDVDEAHKLKWRDVLDQLQFGGERGYGWGRIKGVYRPVADNKCFTYTYKPNGTDDRPVLFAPEDTQSLDSTFLLAHTEAAIEPDEQRGAIEPLVGRETRSTGGFGGSFPDHVKICWMPGGKVFKNDSFQIAEKGIWKPLRKETN